MRGRSSGKTAPPATRASPGKAGGLKNRKRFPARVQVSGQTPCSFGCRMTDISGFTQFRTTKPTSDTSDTSITYAGKNNVRDP